MVNLKTIFLILISFILASCSDDTKTAADKNTIIVATSADNPPYEFIQNGKIVGIDIDIITNISKQMGKKIVIKNFDFPGLLPAVTSKNIDAVIAALTITDERKTRVDFTNGYTSTTMSVLFKKSNNYKSVSDLESKVIGVQTGTTWESYAKELSKKMANIRIRSLSNNLILIEELKSGSIDAIIMEELQVTKFMNNIEGLNQFPIAETKSEFAIILPKDSDLTEEMNKAIDALKKDGTLDQIKAKWISAN